MMGKALQRKFWNAICEQYKQQKNAILLDLSNIMEFSLNGAELSLNSVNSGNSENLRNH